MGILDFLNAKKYKAEIEALNQKLNDAKLTKEQADYIDLKEEIRRLENEKQGINEEYKEVKKQINRLSSEVCDLENIISFQGYGFYQPKYGFENSEAYKNKLEDIRNQQKQLVKDKSATNHRLDWTIGDSKKKGKEFILDTIKLSLRAFNNECDNIITKVKYSNIEASEKRMVKVFNEINALTDMQQVSIKQEYLNLKIQEMYLKYEFEVKQQEEKEEQQAIKERMKEEARVLKEIEAAKKKLEKEEIHFKNAIEEIQAKLSIADEVEKNKLNEKLKELEESLAELEKSKEDVLNREQNTRAGYVYIISNIGSFGEDVYKIGMTRRLEPQERIRELGSASVPFNFDIHAMIFADDAPKLENSLHKRFVDNQVNKVNPRKEFFKISLSEIEDVVRVEFDKPVEFTKLAEAEEYRKSCLMRP